MSTPLATVPVNTLADPLSFVIRVTTAPGAPNRGMSGWLRRESRSGS